VGGFHAAVRILLQRLQENLFADFDHCRACKIACPHCGGKNVEQRWSAFSAITSKKSA
jgi:hypothetical protein